MAPEMKVETIKTVAVLGLGTMGHGITHVFAAAGYRVRGFDDVQAARDSLLERCERNLRQMADAGVVGTQKIKPTLARIRVFPTEEEAVTGAQFVLEAVREDLPTKQALFKRLEKVVSPTTILASNTSTFPMTKIAARLTHPGRCVDMHWFNPPHIVPVVEVVPGKRTSPQTVKATLALAARIGKVPVHVRQEIPGFIVNRVQAAMIREVWDLWERGVASPEDIDRAVSGAMGFRLAAIGPLQVADFGGLDVWKKVFEELVPKIRSGTTLPAAIQRRVAAGHLGPKTGKGIYSYTPESIEAKRAERDRRFLALAKLFYASP
jgi:3-hydroxybutyryl-CoA dehydrogenase